MSVLYEELTKQESAQLTIGPSITTTTFFRGDFEKAAAALAARAEAVVGANPWLAGSLVKQGRKLQLAYTKGWIPAGSGSGPSFATAELLNPSKRGAGVAKKALKVDSTMGFAKLCAAVSGTAAEIQPGSALIDKKAPLLALTLAKDALRPHDTFAVVFSISHVIADGFTYYKILSMLSAGAPVAALSVTRKHQIGEQLKVAMGKAEEKFANSGAVIYNVMTTMLCSCAKPLIENFQLDVEQIEAEKEKHKSAASGSAASGDAAAPFVSTNDILCSKIAAAFRARAFLMPMNFRVKLPDFDELDAGNYEGALVFGPEDYASPALIRQTLRSGAPAFKRCSGRPLPGAFASMRCKLGMVTNWVFPFFDELLVEGAEQLLHLPHCDVKMVPFDVCVVYRARKGRLGVCFFTRTLGSREGIAGLVPVGGVLENAETAFA